jgi:hypothetical protein
MPDKRKNPSLSTPLEVKLQLEGKSASHHTRDLSNNGVFREADEQQLSAVGSIVNLRLKQDCQESDAPLVKAQMVPAGGDGIALKFLDN